MTKEEFDALCDHLRQDRPELAALVDKVVKTTSIMETLNTLSRQCNDFVDSKDFAHTDSEKGFFCAMSDYAITQLRILDMMQTNLSLKIRAIRED